MPKTSIRRGGARDGRSQDAPSSRRPARPGSLDPDPPGSPDPDPRACAGPPSASAAPQPVRPPGPGCPRCASAGPGRRPSSPPRSSLARAGYLVSSSRHPRRGPRQRPEHLPRAAQVVYTARTANDAAITLPAAVQNEPASGRAGAPVRRAHPGRLTPATYPRRYIDMTPRTGNSSTDPVLRVTAARVRPSTPRSPASTRPSTPRR